MSNDEKELSFDLSKDIDVRKKKDTIAIFTYLTMILVVLLVVGGWVIISLFNDVQKVRVEVAQAKQYFYSAQKNQAQQTRRTQALEDIQNVILHYQPNLSEYVVEQASILIFDVGEMKYKIPYEESILFFALESRFKRTALSPLGAKGVGQLMEDTARWGAAELDIAWEGDDTLYNYFSNIRISLFIYKKYRERFNYEFEYYLASYFWGPTTIDTYFYSKNKKLTGKYLNYKKDWNKIKAEVENVINKKIIIPGCK